MSVLSSVPGWNVPAQVRGSEIAFNFSVKSPLSLQPSIRDEGANTPVDTNVTPLGPCNLGQKESAISLKALCIFAASANRQLQHVTRSRVPIVSAFKFKETTFICKCRRYRYKIVKMAPQVKHRNILGLARYELR